MRILIRLAKIFVLATGAFSGEVCPLGNAEPGCLLADAAWPTLPE